MFTNIIYNFRSCLKVKNLMVGNPFTNLKQRTFMCIFLHLHEIISRDENIAQQSKFQWKWQWLMTIIWYVESTIRKNRKYHIISIIYYMIITEICHVCMNFYNDRMFCNTSLTDKYEIKWLTMYTYRNTGISYILIIR